MYLQLVQIVSRFHSLTLAGTTSTKKKLRTSKEMKMTLESAGSTTRRRSEKSSNSSAASLKMVKSPSP